MENMTFPTKGFTHAGVFHADDVFSTALLKILNPDFVWERGTSVPDDYDGIVYDIGGGRFDHHQAEARVRENGVPYAAFGLIWEQFGSDLVGEEEAVLFDKEFVQTIDYTDNTGKKNILSSVIHDMNPEWDEEISYDEAFSAAVDYAFITLETALKHIRAKKKANRLVKERIPEARNNILELGDFMPWRDALRDSNINYVIYKSNRSGFCIQTVPHREGLVSEYVFKSDWRGRTKEELEEITGIKGFTFCHNGGFLCVTDTIDAAWKVAELNQISEESKDGY